MSGTQYCRDLEFKRLRPRWSSISAHPACYQLVSVKQLGWHLPAIFGELPHHLLVQPDVHGSGVVHVASIAELTRECASLGQAVVDADERHEVHNRLSPIHL